MTPIGEGVDMQISKMKKLIVRSRVVILCGVHYDETCESIISEIQEFTQQIIADSISLVSMTGSN